MNAVPAQPLSLAASADDVLAKSWLHGRPPTTVEAYAYDLAAFRAFAGMAMAEVTLARLQAWQASLTGIAPGTRKRRLAAVKSFFAFAARIGAIPANPTLALRLEKVGDHAAERVLIAADVARMIALTTDPRLNALLRLLYGCGLRASEACGLSWRDMAGSERKGGEARILGKGSKQRTVFVPPEIWRALAALRTSAAADAPVVPGRGGGRLNRAAVHRAVKSAGRRAGVPAGASAHWLRHSHASHSLDNGCPIHVLRVSLGHASLETTSKYAHVKAGERSAAFVRA